MAQNLFPFEIKTLIYDNVSLADIKSLRLVSRSWAAAGVSKLLKPTFSLKSSRDIQRLIDIGSSPAVANQAATKVRTLVMPAHGWDPRYFRGIVCNRHELRRSYQTMAFAPNEAESQGLDELDAITAQSDLDILSAADRNFLISALCVVPRADSIKIISDNPFTHKILRKCWEEYTIEAFQERETQVSQLSRIFSAANAAGLTIKHLYHNRLISTFFEHAYQLHPFFASLETLNLCISDMEELLADEENYILKLRQFIAASCATLTGLEISFQVLGGINLAFLPPGGIPALHTLSIKGIHPSPATLLPFLTYHASTLRRLRLSMAALLPGEGTFRSFLTSLQTILCGSLEKFALQGMVHSADDCDERWMLGELYTEDWKVAVERRSPRDPSSAKARELEDFVVRGAEWPMGENDTMRAIWGSD